MLFLVQGHVTYNRYEGRSTTTDVTRLVEGLDEDDAQRKFEQHYDDKSIPNDDSYTGRVYSVSSVIA